jgi:hypothetical protein
MPPGFERGQGGVATRLASVRIEMTRRNSDYFQETVQETLAGKQGTVSRIDLVYGGAPHDEIYFTWRGNRLYQLPIAWLHPLQQWGASLFDPYGAGDFSREVTPRCMECHNTRFEHVPGTVNEYDRSGLTLGVTCERCHGPGRDHVAFHRAQTPGNRGTLGAQFIVQPKKLSRERQMDLCAQCHSATATL